MKDDKYITFKRDEFYQLMGEVALPPHTSPSGEQVGGDWNCAPIAEAIRTRSEEVALPDAVVIRLQDMFAGPALHAYASSIQTVIELAEAHSEPNNRMHGALLPVAQMTRLHEIRDFFFQRALEADDHHTKKVPD